VLDLTWDDLRVKPEEALGIAGTILEEEVDEQGETHQAIACYRDGQEIDHLTENFYQQLMLCYHQTGLHAEAAIAYTTCRKNLAIHLGIAPSPQTEEFYRMIRDHKAS
jgi:DNA-binding SARP family transcriptional activator